MEKSLHGWVQRDEGNNANWDVHLGWKSENGVKIGLSELNAESLVIGELLSVGNWNTTKSLLKQNKS